MSDLRLDKGVATRARLVAAGRSLFGDQGYEATSVEAVLVASEVKRGSLYHHFAGKEALFQTVHELVMAEIAERVATAARGAGPDPVAVLRAGCLSWLDQAQDPVVQRIVVLDGPAVLGWAGCRDVDARYLLGRLRASIGRLPGRDAEPVEQVELVAHMLLAGLSEAALLIAGARDQPAALDLARRVVGGLIDRLAVP